MVFGVGALMIAGAVAASLWRPGPRAAPAGEAPAPVALAVADADGNGDEGGGALSGAWAAFDGGVRDVLGLDPISAPPPRAAGGPDLLATMRGAVAAGIAMGVAGSGEHATEGERNAAMAEAAMSAALRANPNLLRDQMGPDAPEAAVALVEQVLAGQASQGAADGPAPAEAAPLSEVAPPARPEVRINRGLP